jgi:hypothetical protein
VGIVSHWAAIVTLTSQTDQTMSPFLQKQVTEKNGTQLQVTNLNFQTTLKTTIYLFTKAVKIEE